MTPLCNLAASRRERLGPGLGGQRHGSVPGLGGRHRARRDQHGAVPAVRQRDRGPAAVAGRFYFRLQRGGRAAAAVRRVGLRRAPAAAGHAHPGGRGRVHGLRLRADEAPGLRHAARHARRRGPHPARLRLVRIVLLGPQRRPTLEGVARSLGLSGPGPAGPVATITAGWQEREPDDALLDDLLAGQAVNLALYRRWLDVQDRDPEYRAGELRLAGLLAELQELYLLRLDYALQAVYAVQRRSAPASAWGDALGEALEAVRDLDAAHLRRVNEARLEFFDRLRPHDRPVIAENRAAVSAVLADAAALVIAGGHVGVLAEVLHLFNVAAALNGAPVIAWSAGAMALTDRIVLFHDRAARGPGHAEVYGSGLSLLRDVVLLPHARARLLLDDTARMAVFARRFAPARCVPLEAGTRIDVSSDGAWPPGIRVVGEDGHVSAREAA